MKCYFTYCEETGERVLIPQCWGTVHSNDIKDCCCATETANFARFGKKKYNYTIKEKNAEIEALQKEIYQNKQLVEVRNLFEKAQEVAGLDIELGKEMLRKMLS